jgi:DNA-binding transcriptional LysR family regulator
MQVVLQEMAAAENELLETRDAAGLLRVDAATPVMLHFLMPLVKPFRERYPEMTLSLVSSETFINLIERKVDVAIRAGTLTDSSLRARPLFTSYRKIIASPDYVARTVCRRRLRSETASVPGLYRTGIAEYLACLLLRWSAVRDRPAVSSNSGETLKQLCLTGNGIACLSDYMVDKEIAAVSLWS